MAQARAEPLRVYDGVRALDHHRKVEGRWAEALGELRAVDMFVGDWQRLQQPVVPLPAGGDAHGGEVGGN
eukprot:CAMPEP_0197942446 /NCGR_PEP_ID=MMETSP1439-20131203/124390_1 /TAXON_ID=66791 /ORGANISM="Gonyaulax spinifera, Strain CCMP409" /LENGTH=69 /DNA_ID=CAMNT_0043565703 /DNA_START=189 /DNA_END=395 /DNA_ORIENTATION=+